MAKSASATRWLPLFRRFISALRIQSKHAESDPDGTGIALKPWTSQTRVLEQICQGLEDGCHVFYILKSRQLGVTTITLAILIFWAALHPNTVCCQVSDSDKTAAKNRETIRSYLRSLVGFMGKSFAVTKDNKFGFTFSNGSRIDLLVAGKSKVNWGEGEGYLAGLLTEVASYGKEEGLESFRHSMAPDNPRSLYIYESPLALDTPLPTPDGWTTMGDVKAGDWLFDEQGKPCRVVGTSPVFADRKCYRVDFNNGDHIIADAGHKWDVVERRWPTNPQWKVRTVTTAELNPGKHRIQVAEPLELPDADLPIDPYLLGVWLGDGRTDSPRISVGDHDMGAFRTLLEARGCAVGNISQSRNRIGVFTVLGERAKFVKLGLLGHKHIPPQYLRASEEQRRLLLAGLMDTDGSIHKTNFACNFTSTSPELIDGVAELLASLGIKAVASPCSVAGNVRVFPEGNACVCQASTRLLFSEKPDRDVFALPRKRAIHNDPDRGHVYRKSKYLKITAITEVESVPVKCVSVDSPSHLFLAGQTMVPTHNTAHGVNHWKDMWESAKADQFSSCCIFVGWWANDLQRIRMADKRWITFGTSPPTSQENEKIVAVKDMYGFHISMEQLAWYRWDRSRPNSSEMDADQNQPWIETDAFIQTGVSFFHTRLLYQRREVITSAPPALVEDGGYGYNAYSFYLGDEYHLSKVEPIIDRVDPDYIKLRVWEKPHPEGWYVIGVDPAGGRSEESNNHCLDRDTEILTKAGWRRHDQIAIGDEAVCFDPGTGDYSYGAVQRVITREVNEPMYRFTGRGVDMLTTDKHRMVYRYRHGASEAPKLTDWAIATAKDVSRIDRKYIHVPAARAPVGEGIRGLSLDMCRLIGWIATDGHIEDPVPYGMGLRDGGRTNRAVSVGQAVGTTKNGVNIADEMRRVIVGLFPGAVVSVATHLSGRQDSQVIRIGVRAGADYVLKWFDSNGRIKRKLITEGSREQLESLFQGILDGDGNWNATHDRWAKVCPGLDGGFADDVQEIAMRVGLSATKGTQTDCHTGDKQWLVHLSERGHRRIEFQGTEDYAGTVWCVTVPTGAFVARRHGTSFVTGNCCEVFRCFADKMVQVAEWADNIPDTRHCAWVTAYLAGQYANCRINIDLTGGIGSAVMQAFDDLRTRMRSELYQGKVGEFDDFLSAANWYLYRRVDSPGPGFMYNTKLGRDLKYRMMNIMRDSWVSNLMELRSVPLLDEMVGVRQTNQDIGASAPGRQRDDRTFATALANMTWIENLRSGLIAQGITWEGSKAKESGQVSPAADILNRRVFSILRAADEAADMPPPRTFFESRGLA